MARHQSGFKLAKKHIWWELSRGYLETYRECKACFYLHKVAGIKKIDTPGYNINTNTDTLLKRDFDRYRGKDEPHPFLVANGMEHLRPYDFPEKWTQSLQFGLDGRFNTDHEPTKIRFGGGIDDIYENTETGELHIVDYKSTANLSKEPQRVSLDGPYKERYKWQADMYAWILQQKGFPTAKEAYFIYVDGLHVGYDRIIDEKNTELATMKFQTTLLKYQTDTSWVEPTLIEMKDFVLNQKSCPEHSPDCKYGKYLLGCRNAEYLVAQNRAL